MPGHCLLADGVVWAWRSGDFTDHWPENDQRNKASARQAINKVVHRIIPDNCGQPKNIDMQNGICILDNLDGYVSFFAVGQTPY
jgi:2C-methyl-D-erythritol 2,4-cyclodiphosphate synthase